MTDGVTSMHDVVTRTTDRIQQFFRRPDLPLYGLRASATASLSLEQALSRFRYEFMPEGAVRFRLFVSGRSRALMPAVQQQIYLIGRQAVVNALHHSEATSIEAEVEYLPRRLRVVVRDNGRGIDQELVGSGWSGDQGIASMREWAESIGAKLRIWSRSSAGTEIEISVPTQL